MVVSIFFFFFSSRRRHTRCALVTGVQTCALPIYFPASATLVRYYVALVGVHCIGQRASGTEPARLDFRFQTSRPRLSLALRFKHFRFSDALAPDNRLPLPPHLAKRRHLITIRSHPERKTVRDVTD